MGQMTQATIAAWQKASGIEEATGTRAEKFEKLSRCAYDLIRVIELERSGIRDGDGYWHGSDALEGTVRSLWDCWQRPEEDYDVDADPAPF